MADASLEKRLAGLELAVAHLTEAMEELATSLDPAAHPSLSLIESHLHDIRENFNRIAPRPARR